MRQATSPGTDPAALPDATALERARSRIEGVVRSTPLHHSPWLSEHAGSDVYLKLECWQETGSFKLRGATNAVAALDRDARQRGIVTASAGNHGLAVARAAALHGIHATVFVPRRAPETKKRRIRRRGATLRETDGGYDAAAAAARAHAEETGAHYLHAFVDPDVVAGQGTVGLEILEACPDARRILVPVGGGGLLAGIGAAVQGAGPGGAGLEVVGVQSSATRAMHAAFQADAVVPVPEEPTLCDGLAGETEDLAYARARQAAQRIVLVDESAVAAAIRSLYREEGIVAEGSGAVVVAAVLAGAARAAGPTVALITGGNIDAHVLARILGDD
ncbi:MAG: pyridoxal-phosphate dependent enzyme [Gemmatimonadota bacterium]